MAVLAAILPVVSRSSSLALQLFGVAAESPEAAKDFVAVASKVNGFAAILKQVGTIIKEDDRLPSLEVRFLHTIRSAARLGFVSSNCQQSMNGGERWLGLTTSSGLGLNHILLT